MKWLDGITNSVDEFEQSPGVGDGQGSLVCCSPGCKKAKWLSEKRRESKGKGEKER